MTLKKLAADGIITEEQAERAEAWAKDFMKLAAEDPDLELEALKKLAYNAFLKDVGKNVVIGLATALAAGAVTAGMGKAKQIFSDAKKPREMETGFQSMMQAAPHLRSVDENKARGAFRTLHTFNPHYAQDPLVAGTFVQQAMDVERMDLPMVNQLVETNWKIQQGKRAPSDLHPYIQSAMTSAMKTEGSRQNEEFKRSFDAGSHRFNRGRR